MHVLIASVILVHSWHMIDHFDERFVANHIAGAHQIMDGMSVIARTRRQANAVTDRIDLSSTVNSQWITPVNSPENAYVVSVHSGTNGNEQISQSHASRGSFLFTLDRPVGLGESVAVGLKPAGVVHGDAEEGVDYTFDSRTVTFNPGESEKTVYFSVINDALPEGTEDVRIYIKQSVPEDNFRLGVSVATATIEDNDYWGWDAHEGLNISRSGSYDEAPYRSKWQAMISATDDSVSASVSNRTYISHFGRTSFYKTHADLDVPFHLEPVEGRISPSQSGGSTGYGAVEAKWMFVEDVSEAKKTVKVKVMIYAGYGWELRNHSGMAQTEFRNVPTGFCDLLTVTYALHASIHERPDPIGPERGGPGQLDLQ